MSGWIWTLSPQLDFGMSFSLMYDSLFTETRWLDLGFVILLLRIPSWVDGGYEFGKMPSLRNRLPEEAWSKEGQ